MTSITRRDALLGATAAAVVTSAITAPLAIKSAGVKAALAGDPIVVMWRQSRRWLEEGSRYDKLSGVAANKADFERLSDMGDQIDRKAFDLEQKIADMTPESPQGWGIQARLLEDWMAAGTRNDRRDLLIARRIAAYLEGLANAERLAGGLPS